MTSSPALPKLLKARIRQTRLFVLCVVLPVIFLSIGFLRDGSPAHEIMEWVGHALVILCVLGRSYCSVFIGGRKNDVLMTDGPFSVVRNPLYVFSFLGVVGIGLQSATLTLTLLLPLAFVLYYPLVIRKEEAFLLHQFGEAYRAYLSRVPRWIPKLSLWQEPEIIETRPKFVRHTMMDASVFFLAYPLFELIEAMQDAEILPILMHIP